MRKKYGYYFLENEKKDIIAKWGNNWHFNEFSKFGVKTTFETKEEAEKAIAEIKAQGLYTDDVKIKSIIYKVGTINNLEMNCKERFIFEYDTEDLNDKEQLETFLYEHAFCDNFKVISCRNITAKEFKILNIILTYSNLEIKEAGTLTLELKEMFI